MIDFFNSVLNCIFGCISVIVVNPVSLFVWGCFITGALFSLVYSVASRRF